MKVQATCKLAFWLSGLLTLAAAVACNHSSVPAPAAVNIASPPTQPLPHQGETPPPDQPPATVTISWEQLDIGMEPDSVYQPWMMTQAIKSLDGKPVRLKGFMHGAVFQRSNIRMFYLMREKDCPFGPGGQAHHAMQVEMQGKRRTNFTTHEITVEGIFRIKPVQGENGNTWSLYHLEGTSVQ